MEVESHIMKLETLKSLVRQLNAGTLYYKQFDKITEDYVNILTRFYPDASVLNFDERIRPTLIFSDFEDVNDMDEPQRYQIEFKKDWFKRSWHPAIYKLEQQFDFDWFHEENTEK